MSMSALVVLYEGYESYEGYEKKVVMLLRCVWWRGDVALRARACVLKSVRCMLMMVWIASAR